MDPKTLLYTAAAMTAFAANSLLCRFALKNSSLDPAAFTLLRLGSGAILLAFLLMFRKDRKKPAGSWSSATALFGYAAAFSYAYVSLSAGTGALILFCAVQLTMLAAGFIRGERFSGLQTLGMVMALGGLVFLVSPGLSAPPLEGAALMAMAGIFWGVYSLAGRGNSDPAAATAGNFIRATPLAALLLVLAAATFSWDGRGALYAVLSGAVASGFGYVLWYAALRGLPATYAAVVQLVVPIIAALGGAAFLNEKVTLRLVICSVTILGGIALVVSRKQGTPAPSK